MATPIYKGTGQPAADSGWLAGLGSWFGGSPPAYVGKGQSAPGGTASAYKPAPASTDGSSPTDEPERITVLIPRELIDPQQ